MPKDSDRSAAERSPRPRSSDRSWRRLGGALAAASLAVGLVGCSESAPPDQDPAPQTSAPQPGAPQSGAATPGEGQQPPAQTDPMKLDSALLKLEQLPGWQQGEPVGAYSEATIDPPACKAFHQATLEKVASDMGSTAAFQQDDKSVQEYLDLVDKGTESLTRIEQQVDQCRQYKITGEGTEGPVTVERIELPELGEKSMAVRVVSNLDAEVENQVAWVAQGDVLMMVRLEGDRLAPQTLPQITTKAQQQLQGAL